LTPQELGDRGPLTGPPAPVIAAALRACMLGVGRVHLVSSVDDGALLLELFTRDGVGTLFSNSPFDQLRRATIDDVGGILDLIEPLEAAGVLVKRSREKLEREIDHFVLMVRDGLTVACGAVYPYPADGMAELACIAVHPDYRRGGFGASLIAAMESRAAELGLDSVFVLTTQATHWFQEHGYVRETLERLPMGRQALYNYQRNSQVLVKQLRG
jgi:amino-acid N-acetyltransferase